MTQFTSPTKRPRVANVLLLQPLALALTTSHDTAEWDGQASKSIRDSIDLNTSKSSISDYCKRSSAFQVHRPPSIVPATFISLNPLAPQASGSWLMRQMSAVSPSSMVVFSFYAICALASHIERISPEGFLSLVTIGRAQCRP
jgi:hypothetical protein